MLPSDYSACAILLLLYTLQGVPMGLSASVPILLREMDVSYSDLAMFALCSCKPTRNAAVACDLWGFFSEIPCVFRAFLAQAAVGAHR